MRHLPKFSTIQRGEFALQGGRSGYLQAWMPPSRVRGTPIPIPYIYAKMVISHADNHLFHLAIVSDRSLSIPLRLG